MRAFVAIRLPDTIKDRLRQLQSQLKRSGADVKWVAPENMHLTLKFLGEIDEKTADGVMRAIEKVAAGHRSFNASLGEWGAFPRTSSPRVLWVALAQGDREVCLLAEALEEALHGLGFVKENRPFASHITLGRVRSAKQTLQLAGLLSQPGPEGGRSPLPFTVTALTLFESRLTPQGPHYHILKETNLSPK